MGRVLRHDKNKRKTYGLIVDFKAKSTIEICNRVQYYLQLPDIFPWNYKLTHNTINGIKYYINTLVMTEESEQRRKRDKIKEDVGVGTGDYLQRRDIVEYFKREIPDKDEYKERLEKEI